MDGLCRLCGNEKDNLSNIFDNNEKDEKLVSNIQKFLSIEIREDDDLPIAICNICTDELERTVNFVDRSHQAQEHLKQLHEVILLTKNEYADSVDTALSSSALKDCTSNVSKFRDDSISIDGNDDNDEIYRPVLMKNEYVDSFNTAVSCSTSRNCTSDNILKPYDDLSSVDGNDENDDDETYKPDFMESESSDSDSNSTYRVKTRSAGRIRSLNDCANRDQQQKQPKIDTRTREKKLDGADVDKIDDFSLVTNNIKAKSTHGRLTRRNIRMSFQESTKSEELKSASSEIEATVNSSSCKDPSDKCDNVSILRVMLERIPDAIVSPRVPRSNHENQRSTNEQPSLQCEKCEEDFDTFDKYENHMFKEHPYDPAFPCKLCSSTFRKRSNLNLHLRTTHVEKKYLRCSLCDYVCVQKSRLMNHVKDVHEKNLHCSQCNYRTGTKHRLTRHIYSRHTPRDSSFVCEICGKTFERRPSLFAHRKTTHFPEPHQCPECGIVLPSKAKYLAHFYRCSNDKPRYECDICGASYVLKYALMDHVNKHLNVRPYVCDVCGKSFFLRIRLNTHLFVHRGLQFKCDICGRSFNRKDNMKSHQKRQHPS